MSILENIKEVLPPWAEVKEKELPYKMEYEIKIHPILDEDEHFALTNDLKKACNGKYIERYTQEIGEHFFIYTKK
jgi:hypothetical protein